MAREITVHGNAGYRRGCKCGICRAGHAEAVAAWRASKRTPKAPPTDETSEPLNSAPALNMTAAPGAIELALAGDLKSLVGEPPWRGTLSQIALYNARLLDQIPALDRLDLVSPVQIRMLEIFDRLRATSASSANGDVAEEAAALLRDIGQA